MGDVSYQGGIGGFVFACPTGSIKTKLYASTDQFPSCVFQVLQEIETEGYVTREVYVDTHSVNLSKQRKKWRLCSGKDYTCICRDASGDGLR
jgi:Fe-S-cluster-containing hydrogenase component 2